MGAVGIGEISVPFSQVCCEPKTTLKKLRLKKKTQPFAYCGIGNKAANS